MFGFFRQVLAHKCQWYGKELFLADKFYPSTQRYSRCGFVKTGDDKIVLDGNLKHKTKHNEYVCYKCGHEFVGIDIRKSKWAGYVLNLQKPVTVIHLTLGYGNTSVDGSK